MTNNDKRPDANKDRYRTQVREVINRNTVVSLALEQDFNAFLPVYDGGVDFILYRERDGVLRKVQLKARWTIDQKYVGRDIWIAFPIESDWYLMPHDKMLASAEAGGATKTASWIDGGAYSRPRLSTVMVAECAPYRLTPIAEVAAEAAKRNPSDVLTPTERSISAYVNKFGTLPTLIGLNNDQFDRAIALLDEAVKYDVEYANDKEFYEALGMNPPPDGALV